MRTPIFGRLVFGASAVLFGVIALMWHDAYTWQSLYAILSLPLGLVVGGCLMVAQIAGGVGLSIARTTRAASIVLIVVYTVFVLACVPAIVKAPRVFDAYDGFFEQFSLLCGALAVYAVTQPNALRSASLARFARVGFGLSVISFTLAQAIFLKATTSLVPPWLPPNQMFWAILTTVAFALAAIAILLNLQARLALRSLTLMLAIFGVLVWIPLLIAHPEAHLNWSEFALTWLITGAAWVVSNLYS